MLLNLIITILISVGIFFMLMGAIGFIRFPDFYTRLHAAGKCDTLGEAFIFLGLILYNGLSLISIKLFFLIVFIFLTNPVAIHTLIRSAYTSGLEYWQKGDTRR